MSLRIKNWLKKNRGKGCNLEMRPVVSVPLLGLLLFCVLQLLALYLWLPHRIQPAVMDRLSHDKVSDARSEVSSDLVRDLPIRFVSLVQDGRERGLSDTKLMSMLLHALHPPGGDQTSPAHATYVRQESAGKLTNITNVKTENQTKVKEIPHSEKPNQITAHNSGYSHLKSYPWDNITKPINPHNFQLVINQPDFCRTNGKPQDIFLLVLMISMPTDAKQRQMQRDSCLNVTDVSGKKIRSIFLLGDSRKEGVTNKVRKEAAKHGDIIMEDFHESYRNLTLKTLMGIKWASMYCPHAQYVIKSDDDVYLSLRNIVNLLENSPRERFMTGYTYTGTKPLRDKRYKWYIPEESYPRDIYPPYCCGVGYIFSRDLLPGIYTESLSIPYVFLEDVFVGLCIEKLNVVPKRNPGFFSYRQDYEYCKFKKAYVVHTKKIHEIGQYWIKQQVVPANATC